MTKSVAYPVRKLTFPDVISLLGDRKVLTPKEASEAHSIKVNEPIRFYCPEQYLLEAAAANERGADWRFGYVHALSLRQQREKWGADARSQPRFCSNDWWLKSGEDLWATRVQPTGCRLINCHGIYEKTGWLRQEQYIAQLGPSFGRAHENDVTQLAFSFFQKTGGLKRLLANCFHWGLSPDSGGGRVYVGGFDRDGWDVSSNHPDDDDSDGLRVCVSREFPSRQ